MLHIEHFSKSYPGHKRAVDDLSLHVAPGEIFGFIGHNGAGKTTTLRTVAGVMDFTEGTITIDGHNIRTDALAATRAWEPTPSWGCAIPPPPSCRGRRRSPPTAPQ